MESVDGHIGSEPGLKSLGMIDRSSEIQEIPKGRFDGFISYSHAADGLLAPRLQAVCSPSGRRIPAVTQTDSPRRERPWVRDLVEAALQMRTVGSCRSPRPAGRLPTWWQSNRLLSQAGDGGEPLGGCTSPSGVRGSIRAAWVTPVQPRNQSRPIQGLRFHAAEGMDIASADNTRREAAPNVVSFDRPI